MIFINPFNGLFLYGLKIPEKGFYLNFF